MVVSVGDAYPPHCDMYTSFDVLIVNITFCTDGSATSPTLNKRAPLTPHSRPPTVPHLTMAAAAAPG